ncbi:MAG: ABC transporter ATP-binding protein [Candidatus Dormibacteria bacterium]
MGEVDENSRRGESSVGPAGIGFAAAGAGAAIDSAGAEDVLVVRDVVVNYGGARAVDNVSLSLRRGEVVGIIGPNGAGKSSFLGALGGQVKRASGTVALGGRDISHLMPHDRARLGLARTFQTTSEFAKMTVFENLVTAAEGDSGASLKAVVLHPRRTANRERSFAERAWEILRRFEMDATANLYGRELSGGQRRLVEVMRCLMRNPSVLLLDEPMVGVAPHLTGKLIDDLRTVRSDGLGILVVEHALEVVRRLCDRVVVMALGKVIAAGSYEEVVQDALVQAAYLS